MEAIGQPFDPHVHDARETAHSDDHPEGTVLDEILGGYTMGDDVLRPAQVRVSLGPFQEKKAG